jgi:SWI/SNF-related matrix-associated actin-dependent regulator of chromatin subfamily A member 5
MIQYGAESIFQSTDSTVENEDFDAILARSEKKSSTLQEKYKDMGLDDLQQFTSDQQGGFNAYQWEGQNFQQVTFSFSFVEE